MGNRGGVKGKRRGEEDKGEGKEMGKREKRGEGKGVCPSNFYRCSPTF